MKIVPLQEILLEKYEAQKNVPQIQYHANGDCVHIGKISPACAACFRNKQESFSIYVGYQCPLQCPMCYYHELRDDEFTLEVARKEKEGLIELYKKSLSPDFKPKYISFNSCGESLLYLDQYEKYADIIKRIEDERRINIYKHIYTSGYNASQKDLRRLKNMRINEIRFHFTATCSDQVLDIIHEAKTMGFRTTIEEPAWPLHTDILLNTLPKFNSIGIDILNMVEVQVTFNNIKKIESLYPNGRIYRNALYHLYHEGMTYQIMNEVVKNCHFSVLDCNSDVERYRRVDCQNYQMEDDLNDACAEHSFNQR